MNCIDCEWVKIVLMQMKTKNIALNFLMHIERLRKWKIVTNVINVVLKINVIKRFNTIVFIVKHIEKRRNNNGFR